MIERPDATLVIPCLNEASVLREFLQECRSVLGATWELLVADNGSTDGSVRIAEAEGARVVAVPVRGYGSALHNGILAARTDHVVFLDADGTYAPADALRLLDEARRTNADLVIGSRLRGVIQRDAMPPLHRHLGTPVLSGLIRLLHGLPITDCNCGIRCVRRSSYLEWNLKSPGMEYASEMLIRAASSGAKVREIPVMLRRCRKDRVPHLRPWRDGMRHLLTIVGVR